MLFLSKNVIFNLVILVLFISSNGVLSDNHKNDTSTLTTPLNITTTVQNLNKNSSTTNSNLTLTSTTTTTTKTTTISSKLPNCDCNQNGACLADGEKCKCNDGYAGDRCQFVLCNKNNKTDAQYLTQCSNFGRCVKHIKTNEYSCLCQPTHTGALCETPKCLNYCYNNGKCTFVETNSTLKCECDSSKRYHGERCEFDSVCTKDQINKCASNCYLDSECKCQCNKDCDKLFCKNNGVCVDLYGRLGCKCNVGYSGPICTVDECKGYCFNGGECVRYNSTIECRCPPSHNGTRCDSKVTLPTTTTTTTIANKASADQNNTNNANSKKTKSTSKLRSILYGFTITLFICLTIVGVFYGIQKDYFKNTYYFVRSFLSSHPSSRPHVPFARTHNNFSFNKLEDEQAIIQNEIQI